MVRSATIADAATIAAIYNHYVRHTIVTFEEDAVISTDTPNIQGENPDQIHSPAA